MFGIVTDNEGEIGGGAPFASEQMAVNSNPQPAVGATRYAFFSKKVAADAWMYTDEFTFHSGQLRSVMWDSRNSANVTNRTTSDTSTYPSEARDQGSIEAEMTRLAFLIGGFWYVSEQGFLHQSNDQTWLTNMALISDLTFFKMMIPVAGKLTGGGGNV